MNEPELFQYATEIIVAFFGAVGALTSVYLTQRGRAEASRQQEVSQALQRQDAARLEFAEELEDARRAEAAANRKADRLALKNEQLVKALRRRKMKLNDDDADSPDAS